MECLNLTHAKMCAFILKLVSAVHNLYIELSFALSVITGTLFVLQHDYLLFSTFKHCFIIILLN